MQPLALGTAAEYMNAYPLMNAKGIYEGQRGTDSIKEYSCSPVLLSPDRNAMPPVSGVEILAPAGKICVRRSVRD